MHASFKMIIYSNSFNLNIEKCTLSVGSIQFSWIPNTSTVPKDTNSGRTMKYNNVNIYGPTVFLYGTTHNP